ncbi:MAG: hypothetical protein HGA26_06995, partial [Chlorobiaceae bacterium]|nr:hypothetical protein [Chlorobiaceae bacterium]
MLHQQRHHCLKRRVERETGITGSAGKTTTTTLAGRIAEKSAWWNKVWVGGNIGSPLIAH